MFSLAKIIAKRWHSVRIVADSALGSAYAIVVDYTNTVLGSAYAIVVDYTNTVLASLPTPISMALYFLLMIKLTKNLNWTLLKNCLPLQSWTTQTRFLRNRWLRGPEMTKQTVVVILRPLSIFKKKHWMCLHIQKCSNNFNIWNEG